MKNIFCPCYPTLWVIPFKRGQLHPFNPSMRWFFLLFVKSITVDVLLFPFLVTIDLLFSSILLFLSFLDFKKQFLCFSHVWYGLFYQSHVCFNSAIIFLCLLAHFFKTTHCASHYATQRSSKLAKKC